MRLDDVNCAHNNYLNILQCSYSSYIDYECPDYDIFDSTVYCCEYRCCMKVSTLQIWNLIDSSRIWESDLFTGMVRLQGGNFSNQGLVEIKCNSNWGTICSSGFDSSDAIAVCTQLGYTGYISYDQTKYWI